VTSWAFLAVSIVGAAFTINAYRPSSRWQLLGVSFFAGWLTGELALFHLAWQLVATVVFVSMGALDEWPGVVGLGITLVSWIGLAWIQVVALRSARVLENALRAGLGDEYRSRIEPGIAERLARRP